MFEARAARALVAVTGLLVFSGCENSADNSNSSAATSRPAPVSALAVDPAERVLHPNVDPGEADAPKLRIISAAPNITEICCALGLEDWLVGRTSYCTFPPSVTKVPSIGALNDLNVEVLRSLTPDLILIAGESRGIADKLTPLGLKFESLPDAALDDLFRAIRQIGIMTKRETTSFRLSNGISTDLARLGHKYDACRGERVLIVTGVMADPPAPPYVAGPGSFYDDILKASHFENAARETGMAFAPLALEYILRSDPDVIIELDPDGSQRPTGNPDALEAWRKVGDLKAVRSGRVYVLIGPEHYILGPRIAKTYDAICGVICEKHVK